MTEELHSIEEQLDEQINWSKLIPDVLHKIYTFLNCSDRVKMPLVCKDWYYGFHAPDVWKTFHFDFTSEQLDKRAKDIMEFVEDRCIYFKHVQIIWNVGTNRDMILTWLKYFRDIFQLFSRAYKLESIKINFNSYNILRISDSIHRSVCKQIAEFIKSKRNLKRLEFYNCSFYYEEGIDLLKTLIENNYSSLKHLVLRGFVTAVSPGNVDDSTNRFLFPSLETLKIDYLVIFGIKGKNMNDFHERLRHCRKELSIIIFILFEHPEGLGNYINLSSRSWENLKEEYPNLAIEMKHSFLFEKRLDENCFLKKSMPITRLYYEFYHENSSTGNFYVEPTMSFLTRLFEFEINERLVELSLIWQLPEDDLADLFRFVRVCSELKLLLVTKVHPVKRLGNFLESLHNCKPTSLEKFVLNIAGTGNEDKVMLRNLADEFEYVLKSNNLTFDLNFI